VRGADRATAVRCAADERAVDDLPTPRGHSLRPNEIHPSRVAGSMWPATRPSEITNSPLWVNDEKVPHDLMTPEKNVQRIMWTGTAWFGVAVGAVAITLGFLLGSGWRPAVLSTGLEVLWWLGAALVTFAIGLIGWSGCPILEVDVPTADRNKTRTMQLGTLLFIVGGAVAMLAVLLGPAG